MRCVVNVGRITSSAVTIPNHTLGTKALISPRHNASETKATAHITPHTIMDLELPRRSKTFPSIILATSPMIITREYKAAAFSAEISSEVQYVTSC